MARGEYGAVVGMDAEMKHNVVDAGVDAVATFAMFSLGALAGARVTPKESIKGGLIGGAAGFFAALLMQQKRSLNHIADRIEALK